MDQIKIYVTGNVQGVFFRVYCQRIARELADVTGYVKNLSDGRVEIVAEGSKLSLQKLADWARTKGSPGCLVQKTVEQWQIVNTRQFSDFEITF